MTWTEIMSWSVHTAVMNIAARFGAAWSRVIVGIAALKGSMYVALMSGRTALNRLLRPPPPLSFATAGSIGLTQGIATNPLTRRQMLLARQQNRLAQQAMLNQQALGQQMAVGAIVGGSGLGNYAAGQGGLAGAAVGASTTGQYLQVTSAGTLTASTYTNVYVTTTSTTATSTVGIQNPLYGVAPSAVRPPPSTAPLLDASDLMEEFAKYLASIGLKQADMMALPIGAFIAWLVIHSAEIEGLDSKQEDRAALEKFLPLSLPSPPPDLAMPLLADEKIAA